MFRWLEAEKGVCDAFRRGGQGWRDFGEGGGVGVRGEKGEHGET